LRVPAELVKQRVQAGGKKKKMKEKKKIEK
jgi:hypothetical protein